MMMRGFTSVLRLCARLDEVAQHRRGDLEVGDDAVLHRAGWRRCCPACGPSISFASLPTASTFLPPRASCCTATTEGSLETMPMPADVDERVGRAEVDREVAREQGVEPVEHAGPNPRGVVKLQLSNAGSPRDPKKSPIRLFGKVQELPAAEPGSPTNSTEGVRYCVIGGQQCACYIHSPPWLFCWAPACWTIRLPVPAADPTSRRST